MYTSLKHKNYKKSCWTKNLESREWIKETPTLRNGNTTTQFTLGLVVPRYKTDAQE